MAQPWAQPRPRPSPHAHVHVHVHVHVHAHVRKCEGIARYVRATQFGDTGSLIPDTEAKRTDMVH